ELAALGKHALGVERRYFGRDRAFDDRADFRHHVLELAARLGDERGIGGDAVYHARVGELADFLHISGIDKEFHGGLVLGWCSGYLALEGPQINRGSRPHCWLARDARPSIRGLRSRLPRALPSSEVTGRMRRRLLVRKTASAS